MIINHRGIRVFVYGEEVDMRCGFERLSYYIRERMRGDLLAGHVYLFLGRNRRRVKAIVFDGTGLVLVHKRLEIGRFMSVSDLGEAREITAGELALILDGANIKLPVVGRKYPVSSAENRQEM